MILRILFFMAILLSLPLWGIDRMSLRHFLKKPVRWALAVPNVILFTALVYLAINEIYTTEAMYWKGVVLTWTLCIAVPETVVALLMTFGSFIKRGSIMRRVAHGFSWTAGVLVLGGLIYGFTLGCERVVVKNYSYSSSKVPPMFDGYRIVQLSDLHLGTFNGNTKIIERVIDSVNACHPDLVVLTGDLVNTTGQELADFMPIFSRIQSRDGVVSVMGNHDYAHYYGWENPIDSLKDVQLLERQQREMGWTLLLNENILVRHGIDSIAIVGVENDGRPPFPALGDLSKAQKGLDRSCFKVLLSHDPTHWRRNVLPETNIDLTLSGHTHGMQFQLGGFSPASWFYPEWGGEYRLQDGRALYVSLGAGEALLPFRFGAWPEVNLIVLKKEKQ